MFLKGIGFFTQSVGVIFKAPPQFTKFAGFAVTIASLFYFLAIRFEALEIFMTVADFLLLAMIAVPWHRSIYFGAGGLRHGPGRGSGWVYLLNWILIGIVVLLPAMILIYILGFLIGDVIELLTGSDLVDLRVFYEFMSDPHLLMFGLGGVFISWIAVYVILRISMVLPCIAIQGGRLRLRDGWKMSRPLAGPIIMTAGVTLLAFAIWNGLFWITVSWLYEWWGASGIPGLGFELVIAVIHALFWGVQILVGAGTLTMIYMNLPHSPAKTEHV